MVRRDLAWGSCWSYSELQLTPSSFPGVAFGCSFFGLWSWCADFAAGDSDAYKKFTAAAGGGNAASDGYYNISVLIECLRRKRVRCDPYRCALVSLASGERAWLLQRGGSLYFEGKPSFATTPSGEAAALSLQGQRRRRTAGGLWIPPQPQRPLVYDPQSARRLVRRGLHLVAPRRRRGFAECL